MPKLMKPITFGCENGFQEVYYDIENPTDNTKQVPGHAHCYLKRLSDDEKTNLDCLKRCFAMQAGQCWKV